MYRPLLLVVCGLTACSQPPMGTPVASFAELPAPPYLNGNGPDLYDLFNLSLRYGSGVWESDIRDPAACPYIEGFEADIDRTIDDASLQTAIELIPGGWSEGEQVCQFPQVVVEGVGRSGGNVGLVLTDGTGATIEVTWTGLDQDRHVILETPSDGVLSTGQDARIAGVVTDDIWLMPTGNGESGVDIHWLPDDPALPLGDLHVEATLSGVGLDFTVPAGLPSGEELSVYANVDIQIPADRCEGVSRCEMWQGPQGYAAATTAP